MNINFQARASDAVTNLRNFGQQAGSAASRFGSAAGQIAKNLSVKLDKVICEICPEKPQERGVTDNRAMATRSIQQPASANTVQPVRTAEVNVEELRQENAALKKENQELKSQAIAIRELMAKIIRELMAINDESTSSNTQQAATPSKTTVNAETQTTTVPNTE